MSDLLDAQKTADERDALFRLAPTQLPRAASHERVAKGWIFERKVTMCFPRTQLAKAGYARLTYVTMDGAEEAPDTGLWRYPAWDTYGAAGRMS